MKKPIKLGIETILIQIHHPHWKSALTKFYIFNYPRNISNIRERIFRHISSCLIILDHKLPEVPRSLEKASQTRLPVGCIKDDFKYEILVDDPPKMVLCVSCLLHCVIYY